MDQKSIKLMAQAGLIEKAILTEEDDGWWSIHFKTYSPKAKETVVLEDVRTRSPRRWKALGRAQTWVTKQLGTKIPIELRGCV